MLTTAAPPLPQQYSPAQFWSYFPTPDDLCLKCIEIAGIRPGDRIAEPSAGQGHLARWIRHLYPNNPLEVCEIVPMFHPQLEALGLALVGRNFMSLSTDYCYDLIIANPPFDRQMSHIKKMYRHLLPGGRIVTIANSRFRWETTNRDGQPAPIYDEFRAWLKSVSAVDISLPPESFSSSLRPTQVETCILVIDKV